MSEEFRAVTRKKWIARRSINPRLRKLSERCNEKDEKEVDVEIFLKYNERLEFGSFPKLIYFNS